MADPRRGSIHYWVYKGEEVKLLKMGLTWAIIERKVGHDGPFVIQGHSFKHLE